jgi:Asp-tRNA(Asn)/Glu-tRNA(Gln) amidotransferase A subunit family amidase
MTSADLVRLLRARTGLIPAMDLIAQEFDALIMPTTKIVAPLLSESTTPEGFAAKSPLLAGNTGVVNFFDLCAVSLPITARGRIACWAHAGCTKWAGSKIVANCIGGRRALCRLKKSG